MTAGIGRGERHRPHFNAGVGESAAAWARQSGVTGASWDCQHFEAQRYDVKTHVKDLADPLHKNHPQRRMRTSFTKDSEAG